MIVGVLFTSCETDDATANEDLVNAVGQTKVEFVDQNNGLSILEDGGTVAFELRLNSPLPYDAIVTIDVTSSDGSLETTSGVTEVTYDSTINIQAGGTGANVLLTFADDTLDDGSEIYTVSIVNVEPADGVFPLTSFVLGGDLSREVGVFDFLPLFTIEGDVDISLTWASGQDMDLELYAGNQSTSNQVDGSYSVGSVETVTLPSGSTDGDYSVWIEEWLGLSAPVDFTLTLRFPDNQQEVFTGTVTQDGFYLVINRATVGSSIAYSFTEL